MKIPIELIPIVYNISKKVYEEELTLSAGTKLLEVQHQMNKSSARDYIYDFRYLMQGKRFTRTLNAPSMDYFFENLLKDYGTSQLKNSLLALNKHIEYFEATQNTTMHQMRRVYKKYLQKIESPRFITTLEQLTINIDTLETYLTEGNDEERSAASNLIKKGICFVAYKIEQEIRFAPSRFLGYENNTLDKHPRFDADGIKTNVVINNILNFKPLPDTGFELSYKDYCNKLGIEPQPEGGAYSKERKYWQLELTRDFHNNNDLSGEFPEGKIVERTHKARERNSKVIQIAKQNFKKKYGKLFCEICQFDFEKNYGDIGKDFIEGHHTIAVCKMQPDHKTTPEDIAMLCGNCHRMIHKRRPWLEKKEFSNLLRK